MDSSNASDEKSPQEKPKHSHGAAFVVLGLGVIVPVVAMIFMGLHLQKQKPKRKPVPKKKVASKPAPKKAVGKDFPAIEDYYETTPHEHSHISDEVKGKRVTTEEWQRVMLTAPLPPLSEAARKGEFHYQVTGCKDCHTYDGTILRAPSFKGLFGKMEELEDGTKVKVDEAYLKESILEPHAKVVKGYAPEMHDYQGGINDETIGYLIEFIKALANTEETESKN